MMFFVDVGPLTPGHELQDMTLWRSFDWILCLEVGEHVPKQCAVKRPWLLLCWRLCRRVQPVEVVNGPVFFF